MIWVVVCACIQHATAAHDDCHERGNACAGKEHRRGTGSATVRAWVPVREQARMPGDVRPPGAAHTGMGRPEALRAVVRWGAYILRNSCARFIYYFARRGYTLLYPRPCRIPCVLCSRAPSRRSAGVHNCFCSHSTRLLPSCIKQGGWRFTWLFRSVARAVRVVPRRCGLYPLFGWGDARRTAHCCSRTAVMLRQLVLLRPWLLLSLLLARLILAAPCACLGVVC